MRQPSTSEALSIRGVRRNGIDRLFVSGELDVFTAPMLRRELDDLAHPGGAIVLDLRDVTLIDRFGVLVITRAVAHARREAWRLCIVHGDGVVRAGFESAGVEHLLGSLHVSDFVEAGDTDWSPISLPTLLGQREGETAEEP